MSDLIDRAAAIDAVSSMFAPTPTQKDMVEDCLEIIENLPSAQPHLDEWCVDCKEYDAEKHFCPRFNRVIKQTLSEVESQENPRWIPCSERLPEGNGRVLVSVTVVEDDFIGGYVIETEWLGDYFLDEDGNITAWMPLPEPYEGGVTNGQKG